MSTIISTNKVIVLGTALWGWGVDRNEAYKILEYYVHCGGHFVDVATNYPINKVAKDYGVALTWLADWLALHPDVKMSIIVKIGSLNNMGGSESDLRPATINRVTDEIRASLGDSLYCISIHWDNRDKEDVSSIADTVECMAKIFYSGINVGFSGINSPELYYKARPDLFDKWIIQVKENILTSSSRLAYKKYFPSASYIAYGINMGGIKQNTTSNISSLALRGGNVNKDIVVQLNDYLSSCKELNPSPKSFNDLALSYVYFCQSLDGCIIGPRSLGQLKNTITFWNKLKSLDDISSDSFFIEQLVDKIRMYALEI